jgi:hypothetical protein
MSTGKRILFPVSIIGVLPSGMTNSSGQSSGISGDMSQASITSIGFNIANYDIAGLQITWSGSSPTGTLVLNGSAYNGGYLPLPGFSVNSPSGSNGGTLIDLTVTSMLWLQLVYTKISGTGTLNAWAFAKEY